MGRLRYLIADLYFAEKPDRLIDPVFLQKALTSSIREWGGDAGAFRMMESSARGWYGICPLFGGRITFQTFPAWDYMTVEILSFERNPDPKLLYESLVDKMEPAVVSMESIIRGHHIASGPR